MMKQKRPLRFIFFLLASLLLHIVLFFSLIFLNNFLFLDELNRRLDHDVVDRTKDLEVQIELVDASEKQIVEQNEVSVNDEIPEETKFLSAQNQKVKKETKSRNNGAFHNSSGGGVHQPQQTASPAFTNIETLYEEMVEQKEQSPETKKDLGLTGLKPSLNRDLIAKHQRQARPAMQGTGQSQTDDYLEDIEEGNLTLLNTRKFKYFSFYSRVKDQLRNHWNPLIRQEVSSMYVTKRYLASDKKRTSIRVTLNERGYLEEVALVQTSGDRNIDNAAIQAFRLAAPFPNPPTEMLEKDRKIRIFWDFVLET